MDNVAAIGLVFYVVGCLLFLLLCILIFIAPWRCWVHLKGLRGDLAQANQRKRKDTQVILNALATINDTLASIDKKLSQEESSSDRVVCPYCGNELEPPPGIVKGQHLVCPICQKKFSY